MAVTSLRPLRPIQILNGFVIVGKNKMDNLDFMKKFEQLTVKASNLDFAMDIISQKPFNFSEELSEMSSDVEEIRKLEAEVKISKIQSTFK